MYNERWEKLRDELVKGFWTDSQVCHIFSGLIEITENGEYACVEIEEEGLRKTKQEVRDRLLGIWTATEHATEDLEYYAQGFTKFWKTTYCVRWARNNRINIPWLDWASDEGYVARDVKAN